MFAPFFSRRGKSVGRKGGSTSSSSSSGGRSGSSSSSSGGKSGGTSSSSSGGKSGSSSTDKGSSGNSGKGSSSGSSSSTSRKTTPISTGGSTKSVSMYSNGGGKSITIAAGQLFGGRTAGGATRSQVYGSRTFGNGYPGYYGRGVANRGFPFWFWPIAWGSGVRYGSEADYLHSNEYGQPDNSSRPGGSMARESGVDHGSERRTADGQVCRSQTLGRGYPPAGLLWLRPRAKATFKSGLSAMKRILQHFDVYGLLWTPEEALRISKQYRMLVHKRDILAPLNGNSISKAEVADFAARAKATLAFAKTSSAKTRMNHPDKGTSASPSRKLLYFDLKTNDLEKRLLKISEQVPALEQRMETNQQIIVVSIPQRGVRALRVVNGELDSQASSECGSDDMLEPEGGYSDAIEGDLDRTVPVGEIKGEEVLPGDLDVVVDFWEANTFERDLRDVASTDGERPITLIENARGELVRARWGTNSLLTERPVTLVDNVDGELGFPEE
ncbi:hypothetical protein MVEN_02516500 [Mycena venus]|uniref:Uncharacterized protein n=1 Tax=Mycena venus TaxID=2733690 RepID=A0A8H6WUI6_9AGAR|nr:hypothetical protein MVEN_02516500 [Mycena venus]